MSTKMTNCKTCGAEIASNAKSCPHCGAKNKKPIFKKWWFWVVVVLIVIVAFSGGGNDEGTAEQDSVPVSVAVTTTESQPADEPAKEDESEPVEEVAFEEVTAVDNDECTIKITGIDSNGFWGYTLNALFENKSAEKTYMFSVRGASIDGVESDPFFAEEVAPGKKANAEISFSDSVLDDIDISYSDICLSWEVYDSEDWSADSVASETVHIYPYGEDKAEKYVRESQATDTVLVDNDYVTAIITGYELDDIWGYSANIYLVNKTDVNVMFSVDKASVNGFMADPFWATEVAAGNCAFSSMSWSDSTLEENGITEVEEIEFTFNAYDADDWSADSFVNEVYTLTP